MLLGSRSGLPAIVGCCDGVVVEPRALPEGCETPAERSVTGASVWVSLLAQPAATAAMARYRARFFITVSFLLMLEQPYVKRDSQLVGMGPQEGSCTSPAAEVSRWRTRPSQETAARLPRPP